MFLFPMWYLNDLINRIMQPDLLCHYHGRHTNNVIGHQTLKQQAACAIYFKGLVMPDQFDRHLVIF